MTPLDSQGESGQDEAQDSTRAKIEQLNTILGNYPGSYLTAEGHVMVSTWEIVRDVVTPGQAAIYRQDRGVPSGGVSELDWVSSNLESLMTLYRGNWIAVKASEVIASSVDLAELLTRLGGIERPFITFIPTDDGTQEHAYGHQVV